MAKLLLSALLPLILLGCNPPFGGDCACTVMYCPRGILIRLENPPDTSRYGGYSVTIAYGDTLQAADPAWSGIDGQGFRFTGPRLETLRPARIGIRIGYRLDGGERSATTEKDVDWKPFICNRCSGSAPSCRDEELQKAEAILDLGVLL